MKNQNVKKVFKASIQMIITTLLILGILQLIISGIKAVTNDVEIIASENVGVLAQGYNPSGYSYNVPAAGKTDLISKELQTGKKAPKIEGYEEAYCIQNHTPAPVYEYTRIGSGYFSKEDYDALQSKYFSAHTNLDYGEGHVKFPYKLESVSKNYNTVSRNSSQTHDKFTLPSELKTPGYYKVTNVYDLSPEEAYVLSKDRGTYTLDKQNAIWNLRNQGGGEDGGLTENAQRYAKYHEKVTAANGLNPQDISSGVMPMVDILNGTLTFGPFTMSYIDDGTAFDGGISFAGITDMHVVGYNSSGSAVNNNISIGSIVLANGATGSVGGAGTSFQFFNPSTDECIDENPQVYPKSGQSFYVVINNPNVGATSEAGCVTSISIKVKFQYMLAFGKGADLEGKRYVATINESSNSHIHMVDDGYPDSCSNCTIMVGIDKDGTALQGMMIGDAVRYLYEQELDLYASVPQPTPTPTSTPTPTQPPTPTYPGFTPTQPPTTPTPQVEEQNFVDFSFNLAGNVWEDLEAGKESIANGLKDNEERNLKNIKVTLYFANGPQAGQPAWFINTRGKNSDTLYSYINPTYTDENGHYEFRGLDPLKRYYVTFEYDGQVYMPTDYLKNSSGKIYSSALEMVNDNSYSETEWELNSKATEKLTERNAYDNKFASIGSYPENYKTSNSLGLVQGNYNIAFSRLELMGYTLGTDGKYRQTNDQLIDGYLYDENGLETKQYREGLISKLIRQFITQNQRFPNDSELINIYKAIANGNIETARKIQFIEDCKITAYTKAQSSEDARTYDNYVLKDDYIENYSSEDHYTYVNRVQLPDGSYKDIIVYVNEKHHEGIYKHAMYINLGLVRRPQTDISLRKDVYKAALTINGQSHVYKYDERGEDDKYWTISARISDYESYYNSTYNRSVYPSDANYDLQNENKRLDIYVTYKITVRNASLGIITQIDEVVDYYDQDFEFMPDMSWVMYENEAGRVPDKDYLSIIEGKNISATNNTNKYKPVQASKTGNYSENTRFNLKSDNETYQNIYINGLKDYKLSVGENGYIYLTFKLKRDSNNKLLLDNENGTKQNIAEINGYTTWYNDGTKLPNGIEKGSNDHAGIIDQDSNPGNFNNSSLNAVENGMYEHNMEDDTDRAKGIKIYADKNLKREISGIAWEDKRTYSPEGTNALIGNGIREEGEVGAEGIEVTLHEVISGVVKEEIAQVYSNDKGWIPGTATTQSDGTYHFEGYIPGDYIVRFTYNGKTYNGQDYKSTSYQRDLSTGRAIDQNGRTDISDQSASGYVGYTEIDKQNEPGSYGYSINKADEFGLHVSDAKDIWKVRENANSKYANSVTNKGAVEQTEGQKQADGSTKYEEMIADTGVIRVEVEYNREFSVGNNEESNNSSNMNYANGNDKNGVYHIKDLDFGLEERPKAGLELNKQVSNVKLTLADGKVLFDATKSAEDLIWQAKTPYNIDDMKNGHPTLKNGITVVDEGPVADNPNAVYSDYTGNKHELFRQAVLERVATMVNNNKGLIQVTMDEEIMHGATITITYDMTVKNIGEEDYNDKSFYYVGNVKDKTKIVKTSADLVMDYVANNLKYEANNNTQYKWNPINEANIASNGYLSSEVLNAIKGKYNTIITTEELNKKLIPLGSGNEADSIDSTKLVLTQTITSQNTADDLQYKNIAEIVSISNDVGRRMAYSIQGNQNPTELPTEPDASMAENVTILPPFGTHYLYIGLSIFVVAIIAVAVVVIKKTVLKK